MRKLLQRAADNLSVKSKIVLVAVIATLLVTSLVVPIRINQLSRQVNQRLLERLQDATYTTAAIVDSMTLYIRGVLSTISNSPKVAHSFSNDLDEDLSEFLYTFFDSMNQTKDGISTFANLVLYDKDFYPIWGAHPSGEIPAMSEFPLNFLIAQQGKSMVSNAVQNPRTGLMQFLITSPIIVDGQFEGVAAILANTQMLDFFLRDAVYRYGGGINIADEHGKIFFSTRPAYIGKHIDELEAIEAFDYMPLHNFFKHRLALTGASKIAYAGTSLPLEWTIVSFFDSHAVDNVTPIIFTSFIPTVSGIFFAAAAILLILHYSLKPLGALAISAKHVAEGDLNVKFDVRRNDEISQVSRSFQEILTALNILQESFKKAKNAMTRGDAEYKLEDSRLGGIYDEMLASTNSIVKHMQDAQLRAENSSKAKSDFLSKMSHEIRTPMNAIIGMAELILREDLPETARDQAATIKQSGDHLLLIINDILDLSKVESGKLELAESQYLLHSTIQDVVSIIKMRMSNPDVSFSVNMQSDMPHTLYGDEVRVRQILLNILTNALKYTEKGHFSLDIKGKQKDKETYVLALKIKDTGIGIKPEYMDILFDEFAQFDVVKNKNVEGTGLGLAITSSLVKLMKGTIDAKSVYGKGSEFFVTLPQGYVECGSHAPHLQDKDVLSYSHTPSNAEHTPRSINEHTGGESVNIRHMEQFVAPEARVLLVDDIEANLKVAAGLLKLYGVNIDTCQNGKSAIDAVLAKEYDLVFMDHMMPIMDGVEAVKIIRSHMGEKYAKLPIIALTANAIVGAKEMFLENGFNDFLSKPIEIPKLYNILSKWIPKEKQNKVAPAPAAEANMAEPKREIVIDDIEVPRGIALSGGFQNYLDTLSIFRKNGLTKICELADCLEQGNLDLYAIHVHALKSACANIGANKLSGTAQTLETASMKKDSEFITKNNAGFIGDLKKLLENINVVVNAHNKISANGKTFDERLLKEHLSRLKAALKAFDAAAIDEISTQLRDFTHNPDNGEALSEMLQNVFVGKYKQAMKQIDELGGDNPCADAAHQPAHPR